jgi:hypothetical protein
MSTAAGTSSELAPKSAGIIMHIHGGGWVLMDHNSSDPLLQNYADMSGCVAISVGYRLAPEYPFPAGPEDCYDAADWLIENGEKEFGGKLRFIGGEVCSFLFVGCLIILLCSIYDSLPSGSEGRGDDYLI